MVTVLNGMNEIKTRTKKVRALSLKNRLFLKKKNHFLLVYSFLKSSLGAQLSVLMFYPE